MRRRRLRAMLVTRLRNHGTAVALLALLLRPEPTLGLSGAESAAVVTPDAIHHLIQVSGAEKAAQALAEDTPRFHAVLRSIGTAKPEWLGVAQELWRGSVGYSREMLESALAAALERKPEAVLGLTVPLDTICGYDPLTPISSLRTRDQFLRALEPRAAALARVVRPELREEKEKCLKALMALRETSGSYQ